MLALPEHLFPHMLGADPAAWEEGESLSDPAVPAHRTSRLVSGKDDVTE